MIKIQKKAFSLIEIIVVITILAIIVAGTSWTAFNYSIDNQRLMNYETEIISMIKQPRNDIFLGKIQSDGTSYFMQTLFLVRTDHVATTSRIIGTNAPFSIVLPTTPPIISTSVSDNHSTFSHQNIRRISTEFTSRPDLYKMVRFYCYDLNGNSLTDPPILTPAIQINAVFINFWSTQGISFEGCGVNNSRVTSIGIVIQYKNSNFRREILVNRLTGVINSRKVP